MSEDVKAGGAACVRAPETGLTYREYRAGAGETARAGGQPW